MTGVLVPAEAAPSGAVLTAEGFVEAAARIGRDVLAPHAADVDARSRFPHEAVDALRTGGFLGVLVPVELGGSGLPVDLVARGVTELGRHCSSAAMVYAMHLIQLACLVDHATTPALREYTAQVARDGLLLASATTEVGIGGDTRSSGCAVETDGTDGTVATLRKQAPVISYGEQADGVLATARRSPDSPPSDQVLVVCRRGTYTLEPTSEWDALGFRGTCSRGFVLEAVVTTDDVLPTPYADVSARTMLPVSHLLWASLWLGMACAAEARARAFVQAAARRSPGVTPPGALRLSELTVVLQQLRGLVATARQDHADMVARPAVASSVPFAVSMNTLKVAASGLLVDVVSRAMLVCGIAGYANQGPYSLGRLLRDAHGAQLMINNDRIHGNTAQLLLAHRGDLS